MIVERVELTPARREHLLRQQTETGYKFSVARTYDPWLDLYAECSVDGTIIFTVEPTEAERRIDGRSRTVVGWR